MKKKQTKWIKKPDANHTVRVVDSPSFFAEVLEVFHHSSADAAYQTYRRLKKEISRGL